MTEKTPGVAFYGKVRIPTIGHRKAIDTAKGIARKVGGKLSIGLSGTSRPLSSETKKAHAEMMFDHPVQTGDEHTKNLFSYLSHLNQHHDEIHLVAGSDRAPEYRRTLQDWNGRADRSGKVGFNFKKWKVHEVEGERVDSDKHPTQMSRDELEKSVSATKLEGLAKSGDYDGFKAYHPGFPEKHVRKVYNQIRMSSAEEPKAKSVKKLKEEFHDHGELDHKKFGPMLDSFVQFASKEIGIKEMPTLKLQKDTMSSSFGGYNPSDNSIMVVTKNRHPMDIYRTVAHELIHHKQNEDGRLGKDIAKEGSTGSPIENEANAEAGKIMRWFAKSNPEMFKSGYVVESYMQEGIQDPAKMKAVFLAGGPGSGKDWIMSRTLAGHGLTEINSDNAFEHLMKMRGLDPMMPKEEDFERNIARGAAKRITKEKERLALAGRRGVVINGTADDPEKIATIKKHLEDLGYETKMLFVNTNNEVSRQRNVERGLQGNRKVPDGTDKSGRPDGSPDIRGEKWEAAQEARTSLQKMFGDQHFTEVDNSEDYRKVDKNRKKEIDAQHNKIFTHYRKFVSTPSASPAAADWIESEKKKRGITSYQPARATKVKPEKYVPNASELTQARVLGVDHVGQGQFGSKEGVSHVSQNGRLVAVNEDLRNWFKQKWVRFDTKGNIKGDCAREPGEGKPKCRPLASAVAMGKEARAKSARRKRREDPVANRKSKGGKPVFVKTNEEVLLEKNVPTNPSLWARAKSLAKSKFDVYPSAYANGWASKWYKSKGGGWKTKTDESFESFMEQNTPSDREWGSNSLAKIYADATPGQTFPVNPLFEKKKVKVVKKLAQEDNVIPRGGIGYSGIGPETTVYRPMMASGYGGAGTIPMYESIVNWMNNPKTQQRFVEKYGDLAEEKLYETAEALNELEVSEVGPKFFTHLREAWENIDEAKKGKYKRKTVSDKDVASAATRGDKALDAVYGYGTTKGGVSPITYKRRQQGFGSMANFNSAKAAMISKQMGDSPRAQDSAVHKGWGKTVDQMPAPNPEKQAARKKLKKAAFSDLPKDEQDKDTVIRKAVNSTKKLRREAWEALGGRDMGTVARQGNKEEMSEQSFGKAFNAARESGNKEFTWRGKTYTTQKKGETVSKTPETPAPRASSSSTEKSETKPMSRGSKTPEMMTKNDERNRMSTSDQQDVDVEKVRRETGAAAASEIRKADPVVQRMDPEMRKAMTEPKGKANIFTGSRHDQGIDEASPAWTRKEGKNPEGGLNKKGVASYRAANPGSKLQTAVTTEPSKLKPGSKKAKRRLSFCRRMKGMKSKLTSAKTARDPDSRINKSLRKWNCEE